MRRVLAVWLVIMAAETLHGTLREVWLAPVLGAFLARQLAVVTGALIVLAIAVAFSRWMGGTRRRSLLAAGLLWTCLTAAFEIGLGRALGYSWDRLLSDYDVGGGGLMPFGLLALFVAPLAAARIARGFPSRRDESRHISGTASSTPDYRGVT